jgi:predicted phosphodiesterase
MRYAIVSDIHANLRAWDAVLADITSEGVEAIICLGDVVGYGPKPAEVLAAVRAATTNFVMGNHDAAAVGMMDYSIFNDHAREAIEWTRTELDAEANQFLASVPLAIEAGEIFFVHAEIAEPGRFDYIDSVEMARENFAAGEHFVTFVGHTHLPKIFERDESGAVRELPDDNGSLDPDKRYIVNVGSVGEPRNPDDLRGRYVIYDAETREVDFRRIEFDIKAYREDLEATELSLRPYFLRVYEEVVEGREVVVSKGGSLVDMKVAHDSAALVDLGKVSKTVHMDQAGPMLASARPSHSSTYILVAIGVLSLAGFFLWAMTRGGGEEKEITMIVPEENEVRTDPVKPETSPKARGTEIAQDSPIAKVEEATPAPEPEPMPAPKVIEPEPPAPGPVVKKPVEIAWWRMDEVSEGAPLIDDAGRIKLLPEQDGKAIRSIAPDPVPLNQQENKSALQVGVWKESEPDEHFGLSAEHSFTFEGWFVSGKLRRPVFLLGTRTGDSEENHGWHLDLRPPARGKKEQQMAFFYDSGKARTQALAEEVEVADLKPHHFAVVWKHDASSESGEMLLYLDGIQVATEALPRAGIFGKQVNPFRIGAKGNPRRLALDELKFTRKALEPHEFLTNTPILGVKMIKSDPGSRDNWGVAENWQGGGIPGGDDNIIIEEGVTAQAQKSAKAYTGSLVLKKKSSLILWDDDSLAALPKAPSMLVMNQDSRLILRTGNCTFGPIELKEDAEIWGGDSTSGHGSTRHFAGEISGKGMLTLNGVNQNQLRLEAANSFSGGFLAHSTQTQAFMLFASSNQAFGQGDVTIEKSCGLIIDRNTGDTIADRATLRLEGPGVVRVNGEDEVRKLVLYSDETVGGFFIDGKDQGEGVFSNETHPRIGGPGKLTVKP